MSGNGFKFAYLRALNGVQLGEVGKPNHYFRVLVAVWNYADENGRNAFPTIEKLADDCCVSTRTVDRAIKYLIDAGWIRQDSKGRAGRASVYSLTIPEHDTGDVFTGDAENEHDTGVTPTRHGCQSNTTPVSDEHDTGDVPTDPVSVPRSDLQTDPADSVDDSSDGEPVGDDSGAGDSSGNSTPGNPFPRHDRSDGYTVGCGDCAWKGSACDEHYDPGPRLGASADQLVAATL